MAELIWDILTKKKKKIAISDYNDQLWGLTTSKETEQASMCAQHTHTPLSS